MTQHQDKIDTLSSAAIQRNPDQLQFLLKQLLSELDFYVALAVAIEPVYAFVDVWEKYYPEEVWVRNLLVAIASFGTTPDDAISQIALEQDFSAPGAGNYLKAVSDIVQAMQSKHQSQARVGYLVSAVVNAIMAELVEYWYRHKPEAWERVRKNWYEPATGEWSDPEATQISYQFWTAPEIAQLDQEAWLAVADSVEQKLNR